MLKMFCLENILCVLYFAILESRIATSGQDPTSISLKGRLRNILVFDNKLYIGSTDRIFVLNEDLSMNQTAYTCGSGQKKCGNSNQILLLHHKRKELLVCVTGNEGICDVRSLKDIDQVLRNSSGPRSSLKVSMDINRPAQGLITKDGNLTIAVTFGRGIDKRTLSTVEKTKTTYNYAISTRYFVDFNPVSSIAKTKVLKLEIEPSSFKDYVIYYKAGFQINWNTYFVTNQKNYVGGSKYVSKLVRICQNDTDFKSYTDIVIQCEHYGANYNLIQEAQVIETQKSGMYADTGRLFIGVFGRGENPENPRSDSVICLSKIKDLDEKIVLAKKGDALRCENYDHTKRYLPSSNSISSCNKKDLELRDYDFTCENAYQTLFYVIGNSSFLIKSSHKVPAAEGFVTALHGDLTSDGNIVIIVGTSTGNILQMTLSGYGSPMTLFSKMKVTPPVRRVLIKDEDTFYAMTDTKVFLIHRSNCSEISSCNEAMKVRNPQCGWCVYKQRVTRKADCLDGPNHWISSLKNCSLRLSVTPSSIPLSISRNTEVTVTVMLRQLPEPRPGDLYQCTLLNGTVTIDTSLAKKNGSSFICILPRIQDYLDASLKISVRTKSMGNVVLSEAPVLFFQCEHFKRCVDCISRTTQYCEWCTQESRCQRKGSPCSTELIAPREVCPSLADMRGSLFVHTGVLTAVKFDTKYLPKDNPTAYLYTCDIPTTSKLSAAVRVGDSIFCNISISSSFGVPKQDFKVRVSYLVEGQQTEEIDDDYDNFVTVYNCSLLAKDYSHCQALNKSKYNCSWCSNRDTCWYEDEQCDFGTNPSPIVTKIMPRNGPTIGKTKITVFGINFGIKITDIESVEVANIPCDLSKDENDFLVTKSQDYESKVPTQIVCYSRPSVNERAGFVNVIVNGMKSSSHTEYSYKISTVTQISPKFGPIAGGTRVTLFGQNLGIGNRNISVILGNKKCLEPVVKPGLPLEYKFSDNFTIVCTVDGGYSVNATRLNVSLDGKSIVYTEAIQFIFVDNPEVISAIFRKKAFLSGGTKINIVGRNLNNAHTARATLNYEDEIQHWKCEIETRASVICKVPRAPESVRNELLKEKGTAKCLECIRVIIVLHLDNVQAEVEVEYYQDPVIDNIPGENKVVMFSSDNRRLTITGKQLTFVATRSDINITVGRETCPLVELQPSYLTCIVPRMRPEFAKPNEERQEVYVKIGNIRKKVGYVLYKDDYQGANSEIMVLFSATTAFVLICLGTFLVCKKKRKQIKRQYITNNSINRDPTQAGQRDFSKECENSNVYTEIYDSSQPNEYDNVVEETDFYMSDAEQSRIHSAESNELSMPYLEPICQSDHVKGKLTFQIQVEEGNGADVVVEPKAKDRDSYIHPVYCDS